MRTMINYVLAVFLCLLILSCNSKETKYVEIKEPENTKKIIETRYYEIAGEIDGDYIPGEELGTSTKKFYGADNEILLSIENYGYVHIGTYLHFYVCAIWYLHAFEGRYVPTYFF